VWSQELVISEETRLVISEETRVVKPLVGHVGEENTGNATAMEVDTI
jgi:hypothetical protein